MDERKAVGNDGVSKETYGESLTENLTSLLERMKNMSYRPGPVREVLIPKDGRPGTFRPLGIANFEDKLVQKMTSRILESIFEPTFLDCSFGFRPGRGCHDAIRAMHGYLFKEFVSTVIDIDLANFFGTIRSEVVDNILRKRIEDERFLRYIQRLFKAGVLSEGELKVSEEGVPQGSPTSPIIANIVAHHVIDEWFETTVKKHCNGKVAIFRYCDDMVICCERESDAMRIHKALGLRLNKYGLQLSAEKTKLVPFSKMSEKKQGTFDFLGFTFYLGKTRSGKFRIPKLKTSRKRIRSKLKRVKEWVSRVRSKERLPDLWKTFVAKIRGHITYYAVTFNIQHVSHFVWKAMNIVFKWLNRRGGRRKLTREKFQKFMSQNPLPAVRIHHSLTTPQPQQMI